MVTALNIIKLEERFQHILNVLEHRMELLHMNGLLLIQELA